MTTKTAAYLRGRLAFDRGDKAKQPPYPHGSDAAMEWVYGWHDRRNEVCGEPCEIDGERLAALVGCRGSGDRDE